MTEWRSRFYHSYDVVKYYASAIVGEPGVYRHFEVNAQGATIREYDTRGEDLADGVRERCDALRGQWPNQVQTDASGNLLEI